MQVAVSLDSFGRKPQACAQNTSKTRLLETRTPAACGQTKGGEPRAKEDVRENGLHSLTTACGGEHRHDLRHQAVN